MKRLLLQRCCFCVSAGTLTDDKSSQTEFSSVMEDSVLKLRIISSDQLLVDSEETGT